MYYVVNNGVIWSVHRTEKRAKESRTTLRAWWGHKFTVVRVRGRWQRGDCPSKRYYI